MQRLSLYLRGIQGRLGILKCALCKTKAVIELKLGEHDKRNLCLMHYRQHLNKDKVYKVSYESNSKNIHIVKDHANQANKYSWGSNM